MSNSSNNYHTVSSSDSISGLLGRDQSAPGFTQMSQNSITSNRVASSFLTRSSENSINRNNASNVESNNLGYNVTAQDAQVSNSHQIVQRILSDTKCYDLMQTSSKGTVFETTIPFQLAFFALVEHETDVAPLWDPERRQFAGLMTVGDYIHALRVWRSQRIPTAELTARSIHEMLSLSQSMAQQQHQQQHQQQPPPPPLVRFRHADFQSIEAEESVVQLCVQLLRSGNDYMPVLDPESGNLVSILGFLDIVHLLDQAGAQYPHLFSASLQQLRIGTFSNIFTAPKHAKICEILDVLEAQNISSLPIVDDTGKVIDTYHKSDVSFVIKAADTDEMIANLGSFRAEECIHLREQLLHSGEVMSAFQGLVVCRPDYPLSQIVRAMLIARSTKAVVVDEAHRCIGIVSVKDICRYYLSDGR